MTFYRFSEYQTLWQLLVRNFITFKPRIKNQMLNSMIWASIQIFVFTFIMPTTGLNNYGPFIIVGLGCVQGFLVPMHNIVLLISDITNQESNLNYELTLPISQSLIFIKYILTNTYQAFIATIIIFPFGKLMLWNTFSLEYFSFFKFYLISIIICLFASCLSLLIASNANDLLNISNIWSRIIFPLWFLGGFQFSWTNLYTLSPILAYINLLNPLVYALEGCRSAALNPSLFLPYWPCIIALLLYTALFGFLGVQNLQKRLDCL